MRVILWMLFFTGFIWAFVGLKNTSEQERLKKESKIQNTIDSLQYHIDSLQYINDSITQRYQIFDFEPVNNMIDIMNAIIEVESNNNDSAYRANEDAVGCLQIRKCMVDDVNRILKRKKITYRYSYNDRWSRSKSMQMFDIYCKYYRLNTAEKIARCWNGGPSGMQNEMTVGYWERVINKLDI